MSSHHELPGSLDQQRGESNETHFPKIANKRSDIAANIPRSQLIYLEAASKVNGFGSNLGEMKAK
jgi:hypothetical protein